MVKFKRHLRTTHRPKSKQEKIEHALIKLIRVVMGGPSSFAKTISMQIGQNVTKQEVWRILRNRNMTYKTRSIVPTLSVPSERRRHLAFLKMIWFHPSMLVFTDEKKFKLGEFAKRAGARGYARVGERIGRRSLVNTVFWSSCCHIDACANYDVVNLGCGIQHTCLA